MMNSEVTLVPTIKGQSAVVNVLAAGQGHIGPMVNDCYVVIAATVQMTMCLGIGTQGNPAATDSQLIIAGQHYRIGPVLKGNYLSFFNNTAGAGDVYYTPFA